MFPFPPAISLRPYRAAKSPSQSFPARAGRVNAAISTLAAALLAAGGAASQANAADSGVYGGGPFYKSAAAHITEIKNSGFEEAIVWNVAVSTNGDLNFNGEFPLCSGGAYTGASTHSDFAGNMAALKQGTIKRLTFSVGSSNVGVFQAIQSLVNSQGTGSGSILYKNFQALKNAIPGVDAIDFDDENCYDQSSMTKFAVMLGNLGYRVSLCPYQNNGFWTGVCSQINAQRPGTVDRIHLQCYSGGAGNSPGASWNFGVVPVYPGLINSSYTPSGVQSKMAAFKSSNRIAGGWMWLYDQFVGNGQAAQYASAINNALGPIAGTHLIINQKSGQVISNNQSTAQGSFAVQYTENGAKQQQWIFTQNSDTSWNVISVYSGFALEDPGFSTTSGKEMDQRTYDGGDNQRWWVDVQSDGTYKIWNKSSSDALDNSSSTMTLTPIVQWPWNGQTQQRWKIQ